MIKSNLTGNSQATGEVVAEMNAADQAIRKKPSGVAGFDKITGGGLPEGRLTAIIGGPGTGKSLFGLQYLLNRAATAGEPGLFVTFEESIDRVRSNIAGLDWDLDPIEQNKLVVIDARIPGDADQGGPFDFAGLLAGLSMRRAEIGALNVVFDGIDLLMSHLNNDYLERQELVRLDDWIRDGRVTGITSVKSYGSSPIDQRRVELVQYITDCVVMLDAKIYDTDLARTLRVVKYRGSGFVANAVPLTITQAGIEVIPSHALRGSYPVFSDRVSSGVARLDAILDGGYIRGSSILVTGTPGTAKTSLSCSLVAAACKAGAKAVFVSFDESDVQIIANMRSIGIDLQQHVDSGHLVMRSFRSKGHSPEESFLQISNSISRHDPDFLVVDPMSAFVDSRYPYASVIGEGLIDLAKSRGITFLSTSILGGQIDGAIETSASHVSTIADTWIHLSYLVQKGERNRVLTVIKSRGTGHSNQVRELILGRGGLDLVDVFAGGGSILIGSARVEKMEDEARDEKILEIKHRQRLFVIEKHVKSLKAQIATANQELESMLLEAELESAAETVRLEAKNTALAQRLVMRRKADDGPSRDRLTNHPTGADH